MKRVTVMFSLLFTVLGTAQVRQSVDLKELGISFDLPRGWKGKMMEEYIFLGHQSIPGFMVLFENEAGTAEKARVKALEGIQEEGIELSPKGDFQIVSDRQVEGYYSGSYDGTDVEGFAIGLVSTFGSGISMLILTSAGQFSNTHVEEARKLARSVKFSAPVAHEQVTFWKNRIVGYKLKYLYSYHSPGSNGSSVYSRINIDIDLCTNGRFHYRYEEYNSIDTGLSESGTSSAMGLSEKDNTGTFEVYMEGNAPYLDLVADSGKVRTYSLAITSDDVPLLEGDKYYVDNSNKCQ